MDWMRNVNYTVPRVWEFDELLSSKSLNVKFGIDPTGDKLHIGHAVALWKLRELQDAGHRVTLIIGDFTATIGDHSDKTAERQPLTHDQVYDNCMTYISQVEKILDMSKITVVYNSEWLRELPLHTLLPMVSDYTVNQMLSRNNFKERFEAGKSIGMQEFLYPILQGYDSHVVSADLEIGGSEQLFNMMVGRDMCGQGVLCLELLLGTDGKKMSKTANNCIWLDDPPWEMFGKVMSISDELIEHYAYNAGDFEQPHEITVMLNDGTNPRDVKAAVATNIVARYHGSGAASRAHVSWFNQFSLGLPPENVELFWVKDQSDPVAVLATAFNVSKSQVRRVLQQGGLKLNSVKISSEDELTSLLNGDIVQLGKRHSRKLMIQGD